MLKYIFPLSNLYSTPKKLFAALISYIGIYILGGLIPAGYINMAVSVYVYIGAFILIVNYLKKKGDKNEAE